MKWKSTYTGVPLWVNVVHCWTEKLEYRVINPIQHALSRMVDWRIAMIDKYCTCDRCRQRAVDAARWAAKESVIKRASD